MYDCFDTFIWNSSLPNELRKYRIRNSDQSAEKLNSPAKIKHTTENLHGLLKKSIQRALKIKSACGKQGACFHSTFNY